MTHGQAGWIFLLIASICIFCIGMQGSLGVFIAIIFSPSAVTTSETGTAIAEPTTWQGLAGTITNTFTGFTLPTLPTSSSTTSTTTTGG